MVQYLSIMFSKISKLVRLRETVFGLPWVLTSALLPFSAKDPSTINFLQDWRVWIWIVGAFATARMAGMCFNRVIDRHIDAANPRTAHRMLPRGEMSAPLVSMLAWGYLGAFMGFCYLINPLCFMLSPIAAGLIFAYSYTKRLTAGCHFILGLVASLGPVFAWAAVTGALALPPFLLGGALLLSIAGNDIIYAMQDREFDAAAGLHSIPVALGNKRAVVLARCLHFAAVCFLFGAAIASGSNLVFYIGVIAAAGVYYYYHRQLEAKETGSVNRVFFLCNSRVALVLFIFTIGSVLWRVMY